MTPDDAYLARLQATIASLRYWVPTIADVAHSEELDSPEYWKLAITPSAAAACPFELLLRADEHYDVLIAGEAFEDLSITSLDLFVPLAEAIASGSVVQRLSHSAATGTPYRVETVITLANGDVWRQTRQVARAPARSGPDDMITTERHFLPYRR